MIKVMIVEDEKIEREHLVSVVSELNLGIQDVLCASNGEEGLRLFEEQMPQIVIADISMPVMDGLTMIQHIKAKSKETICYILSSYDYFSYAQKALKLGVEDFILKPASQDMINQSLTNAINKIQVMKSHSMHEQNLSEKIDSLEAKIEKICLYAILTLRDELTIQEYLNVLNIKKTEFGLCILVKPIMSYEVSDYLADAIKAKGYNYIHGEDNEYSIFFVLSNRRIEEEKQNELEKLFQSYHACFGKQVAELSNLVHSYNDARMNIQNGNVRVESLPQDKEAMLTDVKLFIDMVEKNEKEGLEKVLEGFRPYIKTEELGKKITFFVENTLSEIEQRYGFAFEVDLAQLGVLGIDARYMDVEFYLTRFFGMLQKPLAAIRFSKSKTYYKKALTFIEKNYMKPINLIDVAESLDITPFYLSKILNENNGEGFSEMVNNCRIAEAKKMIRKGHSFKQVAAAVGFGSQSYFTKIFKKKVGLSPSEYKDMFD